MPATNSHRIAGAHGCYGTVSPLVAVRRLPKILCTTRGFIQGCMGTHCGGVHCYQAGRRCVITHSNMWGSLGGP